jgi:hypothetical protein
MTRILFLLLLPVCLLSQDLQRKGGGAQERRRPAEPAIEFTTTSNASQVGTSFVLGFQFSVQSPVILDSLGAVLDGNSAEPVFGSLPQSMPVSLWDDARNLLVSATVSASDPLVGHFNYAPVANTLLLPGVAYTIAGLVPVGRSVLSDVPGMMPGSTIAYGGPRSLASPTLAYPAADGIGLRNNYFGASFTFTGGASPVARSGRDLRAAIGVPVKLDGTASFSTSGSVLTWKWALISAPPDSAVAFADTDSATPSFVPDSEGVYVVQLIVDDGATHSKPSTVSITAEASR